MTDIQRSLKPISDEQEREINSALPANCEIDVESWGVGIKVDNRACGYGYYNCDTSNYLEREDLVAMLAALDKAEAIRNA